MIDRRSFLTGLATSGIFAWLPGCSDDKKNPVPASGWDIIVSARDVARQSPDHLCARAAEIVASKDFSRAVRFVQGNIAVVPPINASDDAVSGVRWGADGALRAGAGTQRERADLLAAMLVAMGATAKVKMAARPSNVDAAAIYATKTPAFSMDVGKIAGLDDAHKKQIQDALSTPLDADSSALAGMLDGLVPNGMAANPTDGVSSTVPVVEYTANGVTKWAFALGSVDEVMDSPMGLGSELSPAQYPTVTVRLLAAMGDVPGVPTTSQPIELAAGTWKADQLAGTRLFVTTSSIDPASTINAPSDLVTLRIAALRAQQSTAFTGDPALWTPKLAQTPDTIVGKAFTTTGAALTPPAKDGDPWAGPYGNLVPTDANHAALVASVASLQVTANGGAFPDVQLTIAALDGGGKPIYGLVASDLVVSDEQKPQATAILGNAKPNPLKVMLAYDCSGSVTWPQPADRDAFNTALANALVAANGQRPYQLGVATLGTDAGSYVTPDATAIETYLSSCVGFSEIWLTLGQLAEKDGASVVILVSDFSSSDDPNQVADLQKKFAASGITVALVPIGASIDQSTIDAINGIQKSPVIDHASPMFGQQITDFVTGVTTKADNAPYRGGYRLTADQQANQGTRTVNLTLAGTAITATTTYLVPPIEKRGAAGIRGLYLEMQIGVSPIVRRHLAGPMLDRFGAATSATQADLDQARQLLDGMVTIAFEPGAPTDGANVEDMFSGALSMRPLFEFGNTPAKDTLDKGSTIRPYNTRLAAMVTALPQTQGGPRTASKWLRTVISIESASSDSSTRRLDVVPELNVGVAATTDPRAAFDATLRNTVPLSIREGIVLAGSAASQLSNATLQYLAPAGDRSKLTGFAMNDLQTWARLLDQYDDWHKLVPTTPNTSAMWIVHPTTGTAIAVSIDGSGGGCDVAEANANLQKAIALFQCFCAYAASQCQGEKKGFACLGAADAANGAQVVAIFAGAALPGDLGATIFVALVEWLIPMFLTAIGFGSAYAAAVVAGANLGLTLRQQQAATKNCP